MQYRKLGSSDLIVSEIALGSWLTYSGGVDRDRSIACVRRALALGITLLDTANVYGRGAAETLLGEALKGVDRSSYAPVYKGGHGLHDPSLYEPPPARENSHQYN